MHALYYGTCIIAQAWLRLHVSHARTLAAAREAASQVVEQVVVVQVVGDQEAAGCAKTWVRMKDVSGWELYRLLRAMIDSSVSF